MRRLSCISVPVCIVAVACAPIEDVEAPAAVGTQAAAPTPEIVIPDNIKRRVEAAIDEVALRELQTTNAFWTTFHGALTYGPGLTLSVPNSTERVQAFEYMLTGDGKLGRVRGLRYIPTPDGLDVGMGPPGEGQGHRDQWVAILAQWDYPIDQPVHVGKAVYTIKDLVTEVQAHARVGEELSWTNMVLAKYTDTDQPWVNNEGQTLHYDELIRSEVDASINDAACGGSHRLSGLSYCLNAYLRKHKIGRADVKGVWRDVVEKIDYHIARAKELQNSDGTFSTSYFREPGNDQGMWLRINSTGHVFEWLSSALPPDEIRKPWMQDAAAALATLLLEIHDQPMESGALYHATHGLVVYYSRVFGWEYFESKASDRPILTGTDVP